MQDEVMKPTSESGVLERLMKRWRQCGYMATSCANELAKALPAVEAAHHAQLEEAAESEHQRVKEVMEAAAEHERLAVAEALRRAANGCRADACYACAEGVLSFIPAADSRLLDEHDSQLQEKTRLEVLGTVHGFVVGEVRATGHPAYEQLKKVLDERIAAERLQESEWWFLHHKCDNTRECEACNRYRRNIGIANGEERLADLRARSSGKGHVGASQDGQ